MKYKKFVIENYKGITNPIEIDVEKNSLIPIIGINECGKTTILNAIYAFDYMNDWQNATYSHLNDLINLYKISNADCKISAIIGTTKKELSDTLKKALKLADSIIQDKLKDFQDSTDFDITITRVLSYTDNKINSKYELFPKIPFRPPTYENTFCENIIIELPYILYFDDFREVFPDEIEIVKEKQNVGWLPIIQELFFKTDETFSVYDLKDIEVRRRKTILSQVKRKLNETLTSQWANFRLENKDALEIDINFDVSKKKIIVDTPIRRPDGTISSQKTEKEVEKYLLKFDIIETDSRGVEHFFYIKNRSKGFFWFFNFVMKLEFNPDKAGDQENAIYLLDEPGSYLHPFAQSKLCKKLKELSKENIVMYCTHSHYLLNPEIIPLNKIIIANKNNEGEISIKPYYEYKSSKRNPLDTAFKTINEALFIKPFDLDINNKRILIVEGIYDYYAFTLFKENRDFGILPGKGADSLLNFISLMIAFEIEFKVLWDNDSAGLSNLEKAKKHFGEEMADNHFFLLPSTNNGKTILQDLFYPADITQITSELKISPDSSFEKKLASLFFSSKKTRILKSLSENTKANFTRVFEFLGLD